MIWDIDQRDAVYMIQDTSPLPSLLCCMISPVTGRYLAVAGEDTVLKVIDITTNQIISVGNGGHSGGICCVSWTRDERQIITAGKDNCMCVWNFYLGGER
jgi:WD40 repeat protein